jgi:hypothetical protein
MRPRHRGTCQRPHRADQPRADGVAAFESAPWPLAVRLSMQVSGRGAVEVTEHPARDGWARPPFRFHR